MDEVGSLSSLILSLVILQIQCSPHPVPKFYWFQDLSEFRLLANDHLSAQETERVSNGQQLALGSHPITVESSL